MWTLNNRASYMQHTRSGEWKLTTVSGCIVPRSSSREGHVTALIANATLRDHSNYMLSGIECL